MIDKTIARKCCCEDISLIENYNAAIADTTQKWQLHHRLELTPDGRFANTRDSLIMYDMYYNRPANELIFLTRAEHRRIHNEDKALPPEKLHRRIEARRALEALNRKREAKRRKREEERQQREETRQRIKAWEEEMRRQLAAKREEHRAEKRRKREEKPGELRYRCDMTKAEFEALRAAAIAETNRKLRAAYHLD